MAKPNRFAEPDYGDRNYFVTAVTWERRALFRNPRWADLLLHTLLRYRTEGRYQLHDFVIMPEHLHAILTPREVTLQRVVQFIKGGYSHTAGKSLNANMEIWMRGFSDVRLRDTRDYMNHREYIYQNPVKRGLVANPADYAYVSCRPGLALDPVPDYFRG